MGKRTCDERTLHISMRPSAHAFSAFKADPAGPRAKANLSDAFAFIESIKDPRERAECARRLARQLLSIVDGIGEGARGDVSSSIASQLSNPSTTRTALENLLASDSRLTEMRGETADLKMKLDRIIRDNPRLSGMGEMRVNIGSNEVQLKRVNTLPKKMQNWWFEKRWQLAGFGAAIISLMVALAMRSPSEGEFARAANRHEPAAELKSDAGLEDKNRITPEDPTVLKAVAAAVGKRDGNLSMQQIFSVYDYVVKNVLYTDISDPSIPRWPKLTLESKIGDCKSMAVLLSSMLEAIGAKTILIDWYSPIERTGHTYLGVMVSESAQDAVRRAQMQAVKRTIYRRYWRVVRSHYGGMPPALHLGEYEFNGNKSAYLLLDTTGGTNALPGMALRKPALEKAAEARPGKSGYAPEMK